MKVVLFGPAAPFQGGVPLFTDTLTQKLRDAGHEAVIVGFRKLSLFSENRAVAETSDSIESVFIPWQPRTWKIVAEAIARHNPDLILVMWWLPIHAFAYRAVRKHLPPELQLRWVYVIHDVISHDRWPGECWLAKGALASAGQFLVLSHGQERVLRQLLVAAPVSITYAPHPLYDTCHKFVGGVSKARASLGLTASRVLLFFGYVRPYKGLDLLLKAMPEILRDFPDTQLLIAGPFCERRACYKRLIKRLAIGPSTVIHDRYFSGDDIGLCFAAADCVILPYRRATQSGVIPAAYALNTPVIAARVDGLEEYVRDGETGYLIEPNNPAAIVEAVRRFYEAGGSDQFTAGMTVEAACYSWNSMIETLEHLTAAFP